jgi:two-component system, chemotaxis family, protein-glutamate methylesterase/glutaminase
VHVLKGPRENRHRPAIDPLFRTAARAFESSVIAVVLSGNLDDGSAGLLVVRTRGGIAMLQDPSHARASEMPRRALEYAGADYVLPVSKIAPKLIELVNSRDVAMKRSSNNKNEKTSTNKTGSRKGARASEGEVRANEQVAYSEESNGKPSVFACPECSGVL